LQAAQEQIAERRAAYEQQTQRLLAAMERKEQAAATTARKTMLLDEKRRAIDAVFTRARERLIAMPAEERAALHRQLAAAARGATTLARVKCNPADRDTIVATIPDIIVEGDEHIIGGLIGEDTSTAVRLDYTYDTMLDSVRERALADLSRILF
jgi:vacuolar-type H+-ATPase subunit E/Vma4